MEKLLETAWVGPQVGGAGSLEITKFGQTVLAMLMETQIWHQPAIFVGGGLKKGIMASVSTFVRQKAASLVLALVPFELLPQCWSSEEESKNKFVSPLRGTLGL